MAGVEAGHVVQKKAAADGDSQGVIQAVTIGSQSATNSHGTNSQADCRQDPIPGHDVVHGPWGTGRAACAAWPKEPSMSRKVSIVRTDTCVTLVSINSEDWESLAPSFKGIGRDRNDLGNSSKRDR